MGPTRLDRSLLDDGLASLEANRGPTYYGAEAAAQYYRTIDENALAQNC